MYSYKSYHARKYADDGELDVSQPNGSLGGAVFQDHLEIHTYNAISAYYQVLKYFRRLVVVVVVVALVVVAVKVVVVV